jgi:hypothetical protein
VDIWSPVIIKASSLAGRSGLLDGTLGSKFVGSNTGHGKLIVIGSN